MAKKRRQSRVREAVESGQVRSQRSLSGILEQQGIHVTQSTLSRDILELGLVKVRAGGVSPLALEGLAESAGLWPARWPPRRVHAGTVLELRRSRLQVAMQEAGLVHAGPASR